MGRAGVVLLVLAVVLALLAPASAPAAHGKNCGIVSKGSADYRVRGQIIKCKHARKWVRRFFRYRGRPDGYSCSNPEGAIRLYCTNGTKTYWATRL